MKKLIAALLVIVMVAGLCTACSEKPATNKNPEPNKETVYTPIFILAGALGQYTAEDAVFYASIDMVVDLEENRDYLQSSLYIPEDQIESVTAAATMMHINANSFTSAALELAEGTDVNVFAEALKESIMNTQWLCGRPPEKLMIATVSDSFVVIAYGFDNDEAPLITTFQDHLKDAHGDDVVIMETVEIFI